MPQAMSLNQSEQFFGQVGGVVSGALKGLRHKQDVDAALGLIGGFSLQMPFTRATTSLHIRRMSV